MNYLLIDVGNTETKLFFYKKKLTKKIFIKSILISEKTLKNKLRFIFKKKNQVNKIILSSVVPNLTKKIKKFFINRNNLKVNELKDFNLKKYIKIKLNKKYVGSDRIANAIGVDKYKNYIVIDFGTATTFDVIIKNQYYGGIISPGVQLSLETLFTKASLIDPIKLKKIKVIVGKNTKEAVRSGFFWGYIGLINNIIELILKKKRKKFDIILTGGLAHLFKNSLNYKVKINKDLTMMGLLKVAKKEYE